MMLEGSDRKDMSNEELEKELDTLWILLAAFLVFMMQVGFAMLEAGSVTQRGVKLILRKNVLDACVSAVVWYLVGYGFAFGKDGGGFIGATDFLHINDSEDSFFSRWVFSWTFAATAATLVSGAIAERCRVGPYAVFSVLMTMFIYPVVVHWVWSEGGWLSMYRRDENDIRKLDPLHFGTGLLDFAGSGVVHLTGGVAAFVGSWIIGPRDGRFDGGGEDKYEGSSLEMAALGGMLIWFGWYGFNGGSTGCLVSCITTSGKISMNTTIAAGSGGVVAALANAFLDHDRFENSNIFNGILAGLVSITAGCALVEPYGAIVIGGLAGAIYFYANKLLMRMKIDDPLGASAVHAACGFWGLISVGLFATEAAVERAYLVDNASGYGLFYGWDQKSLKQLGIQFLGAVVIISWAAVLSGVYFGLTKKVDWLRIRPPMAHPRPNAAGVELAVVHAEAG